jgi:phi LC3 family holin
MQINWKVRFQNKTFLAGLISLVVVFIYDLLQLLEIVPTVTQSAVMQVAEGILTILGMVGVIADPTTAGVADSKQAMTYDVPKQD